MPQRSGRHGEPDRRVWRYSSLMDRRLPSGASLLVRTDFSSDEGWIEALRATSEDTDEDDYWPQFTVVDDRAFEGLTVEEVRELRDPDLTYVFLADECMITDPEHPILAVETWNSQVYTLSRILVPGLDRKSRRTECLGDLSEQLRRVVVEYLGGGCSQFPDACAGSSVNGTTAKVDEQA